jgi:hypothetical protein
MQHNKRLTYNYVTIDYLSVFQCSYSVVHVSSKTLNVS